MPSRQTFYLVPADAVTQPTVATPRPLAPSRHVVPAVQFVMKSINSPKRPLSADPVEMLLGESSQPHQRKRECLDHLTHEQKLNRRKMKNRIAAQTARDRKKYRCQRLEDVIRELLEQNEILKQENELLRIQNDDLSKRNKSLMARFSSSSSSITFQAESKQPTIYEEFHHEIPETSGVAVESAAFISGPLPRVQAVPLYLLLHLIINILLVVCSSQKNSRKYSTTSMRYDQNLEFDLDQLCQQIPNEQLIMQACVNTEEMPEPACPASSTLSPVDASFLNVPRCSPSIPSSSPLLNSEESVDEVTLFDNQKLLDDPMLSSPSSWLYDSPHALSPFSDSFQREFFQMLE